jgi:hypothetical protein
MSHPLDYFEGSKAYQSLIPRCSHGTYRPFGDPQGQSSCCEICNGLKQCRGLSQKQLRKSFRKLDKTVPRSENAEAVPVKACDGEQL